MKLTVDELSNIMQEIASDIFKRNFTKYTYTFLAPSKFDLKTNLKFMEKLQDLLKDGVYGCDSFDDCMRLIEGTLIRSNAFFQLKIEKCNVMFARSKWETRTRLTNYYINDTRSHKELGPGNELAIQTEEFIDVFFKQFEQISADPRVANFRALLLAKNGERSYQTNKCRFQLKNA